MIYCMIRGASYSTSVGKTDSLETQKRLLWCDQGTDVGRTRASFATGHLKSHHYLHYGTLSVRARYDDDDDDDDDDQDPG
jgi:hypothetical protein